MLSTDPDITILCTILFVVLLSIVEYCVVLLLLFKYRAILYSYILRFCLHIVLYCERYCSAWVSVSHVQFRPFLYCSLYSTILYNTMQYVIILANLWLCTGKLAQASQCILYSIATVSYCTTLYVLYNTHNTGDYKQIRYM